MGNTVNVEVRMDPVTIVLSILKLLAAAYGSGIVQKALLKFQAQEIERKDFEQIAPNDEYSDPTKAT